VSLAILDAMSGAPIDPRDLRVSDDERSHVLALLEKATGRGLIDIGEYTERSAKVIHARTRRDLNAVLLDLPGLQIAGRSVDDAQHIAQAPTRPTPGFSGAPRPQQDGGVLELTGWGSRTFRGYWTAPPLIVIGGTGASTRLDFSTAQLVAPTVTVEFHGNYGGSAEFVVSQGSTVRLEHLQMRGGNIHNKVPPTLPGQRTNGMTLVLTGTKKGGSVSIRHPRHGMFSQWF
jgi:hypothetical protein